MKSKQIIEDLVQTSNDNYVFKLQQDHVSGSVVLKLVVRGIEAREVKFKELGGNYIELLEEIPKKTKLRAYYDVQVSEALDINIMQRVRELESKVAQQGELIETLLKAMENRVDKHTFRVWLKAMEKSFGKQIIGDSLLGIQSVRQSLND